MISKIKKLRDKDKLRLNDRGFSIINVIVSLMIISIVVGAILVFTKFIDREEEINRTSFLESQAILKTLDDLRKYDSYKESQLEEESNKLSQAGVENTISLEEVMLKNEITDEDLGLVQRVTLTTKPNYIKDEQVFLIEINKENPRKKV